MEYCGGGSLQDIYHSKYKNTALLRYVWYSLKVLILFHRRAIALIVAQILAVPHQTSKTSLYCSQGLFVEKAKLFGRLDDRGMKEV